MVWDPLDQLSAAQQDQLRAYSEALIEHNRRVNLISRADVANVFGRHVIHSLALTIRPFPRGSTIADWGTGGGLPAIPLAIANPDCLFVGVDSIQKKTSALKAIVRAMGLANLEVWNGRAEDFPGEVDFSVSRATAPLADLWSWHERAAVPGPDVEGCWRRGLLCLKGGDLSDEISRARDRFPGLSVESHALGDLLDDDFFSGKVILECSRTDEPALDDGR